MRCYLDILITRIMGKHTHTISITRSLASFCSLFMKNLKIRIIEILLSPKEIYEQNVKAHFKREWLPKSQQADNHTYSYLKFFFPNIDLILHLFVLKDHDRETNVFLLFTFEVYKESNQQIFYKIHLSVTVCFIGYGCSRIKKRKKGRSESDKDGYKNRRKMWNLWGVRMVQLQLWTILTMFL